MHKGHFITGTIVGTGAALTIQTGFKPDHVRVVNETGLANVEWFKSMPNGHGIKTITAGTMSKITANGITPYEGSRGADAPGFTIGADADINVATEVLHWIAFSADS